MNKQTYIYALVDPRDNTVKYIGKADDPQKRLVAHIHEAKQIDRWIITVSLPPRTVWIYRLVALNLKPILFVIDKCGLKEWRRREDRWIQWFLIRGAGLLNQRRVAGMGNMVPSIQKYEMEEFAEEAEALRNKPAPVAPHLRHLVIMRSNKSYANATKLPLDNII